MDQSDRGDFGVGAEGAVRRLTAELRVRLAGQEPCDDLLFQVAPVLAATRGRLSTVDLLADLAAAIDDHGAHTDAEAVHRRAGQILATLPIGASDAVVRVRCARLLGANLLVQGRDREADAVLAAAAGLAEALLGLEDASAPGPVGPSDP